jgi:hypothetical protein
MQLPLLPLLASSCNLTIPTWHVLGPWQIGTREAEWGSDPLERFGGFTTLSPSGAEFTSSLPIDGSASWQRSGHFDVDWQGLRDIYGWSALQFAAWARGEIAGCGGRRVRVWVEGAAVEVWVGERQFFGGDWAGYRRAPILVELEERTDVSVRVAGDVRAFGNRTEGMGFSLVVEEVVGGLVVDAEKMVVADVVEGRWGGGWVGVGVRNEDETWVTVVGVETAGNVSIGRWGLPEGGSDIVWQKVEGFETIRVAPGQSRPVKFRVMGLPFNVSSLELVVRYRRDGEERVVDVPVKRELNHIEHWWQPQKYT